MSWWVLVLFLAKIHCLPIDDSSNALFGFFCLVPSTPKFLKHSKVFVRLPKVECNRYRRHWLYLLKVFCTNTIKNRKNCIHSLFLWCFLLVLAVAAAAAAPCAYMHVWLCRFSNSDKTRDRKEKNNNFFFISLIQCSKTVAFVASKNQ